MRFAKITKVLGLKTIMPSAVKVFIIHLRLQIQWYEKSVCICSEALLMYVPELNPSPGVPWLERLASATLWLTGVGRLVADPLHALLRGPFQF